MRPAKMLARLRCGGNLPLCLAFGTGEGLLWHEICVPCSKRLPGVRDAFSEACRAKSSTCRTGRIFSARNGPRSEVSKYKKRGSD